jgi:hypothetical protein
MPGGTATVVPVNAKFVFDQDAGTFRLRVNTQIKRPDGTRYEIEIETSADLGALMSLVLSLWSGSNAGPDAVTAMARPSQPLLPTQENENYGGTIDHGTAGDVGDADPGDDIDDATAFPPGP